MNIRVAASDMMALKYFPFPRRSGSPLIKFENHSCKVCSCLCSLPAERIYMHESVFQIAEAKEISKDLQKRIKTSFVIQQLPSHDFGRK